MIQKSYCGYIAIIGRTNVGKSTLFNKILKKKISITSKKSKTTQQNITGIHTADIYQSIYIDTPGINKKNFYNLKKIFKNVECILLVVDRTKWYDNENYLLNYLKQINIPVLLVVNKIDLLKNKSILLKYIDQINKKFNFLEIFFISAKKKLYLNLLISKIQKLLPKNIHYFPSNNITDCSQIFLIKEIIREQFIRYYGDEIPYIIKIKIDKIILIKNKIYDISSFIIVSTINQKKILIGKNGRKIKKINNISSLKIEKLTQKKVNLIISVKIKKK